MPTSLTATANRQSFCRSQRRAVWIVPVLRDPPDRSAILNAIPQSRLEDEHADQAASVALATAVVLLLVVFGSPPVWTASAVPDVHRGGTLTMSLGPDFTTLDHWYDVDGFQFRSVIYEAPIRPNKTGTKYEPWPGGQGGGEQ